MATLGMPPLPPDQSGAASATPAPPSMMQLAGMGAPQAAPQTSGMSQIAESAVRMGAEIDQALKLLAQAIPQLAPWVEQTTMQLRYQLGTALNSGAMPTNPAPADQERFPDGGGRL